MAKGEKAAAEASWSPERLGELPGFVFTRHVPGDCVETLENRSLFIKITSMSPAHPPSGA